MIYYMWENLFKKENKNQHIVEALKKVFLFKDLGLKEILFIRDLVHIRSYRNSETIFKEGELGVGMYVVLTGKVEVLVHNSADETKVKPIATLGRGDFFGELSLVDETDKRTAEARALGDTDLIGFFRPDLTEIVERNPSTGAKIYQRLSEVLGRRLKETVVKVTELKKELNNLDGH